MLNYLVYCDFATVKCDFKEFAKFLGRYTDDYQNINNDIWLIQIDDNENPFYYDMTSLAKDLENEGYADKDSVIFVAKYSDLFYRHCGIDESLHAD